MVREWKKKPTNGKLHINNALEMQILLACNWNCHACDQFSNLPSISWVRKATMTLNQVERFCEEMRTVDGYIGRIRVLGGEPTLHPKFVEICEMLRKLKDEGHAYVIEVVTNGSKKEKYREVKDIVKVRVSGQGDKEKHHTANLVQTPIELGYRGKICSVPWHCGISLNYYGYFPCSSGAGLARLQDDMLKWQKMELPTEGVMETWPHLQEACDHCYHGLKDEDKIKCGTHDYEKNVPSQKAWAELAPWLHGKQPDWKVYGE
jgi:hypothetical protein